jgi:phosphoribosyl-ATP pyrophosphohydrolase
METGAKILDEVFAVIEDRKRNPRAGSYVSNLLASGRALEKFKEEAEELARAAAGDEREAVIQEGADLIFHTMVLLSAKGVGFGEVMEELKRRRRR